MGITVIRIILMLIGFIGPDADVDGIDIDGDGIPDIPDGSFFDIAGLHLVSINSLVAGLAIGTWAGYFTAPYLSMWLVIIITICAVLVIMYLYAVLMRAIYRLQSNGTVQMSNAIGLEGTVYLTVPPQRSGEGKVNVVLQNRFCEFEAITDCSEKIPTGTTVKITGIFDEDKLIIEPIGLKK